MKAEDPSRLVLDEAFLGFAQAFSKDLRELSPLSKLEGINGNKWARSRLPNLAKTEADFAEDLMFSVNELLNPDDESLTASHSWQISRMRLYAVA